VTCFCQRCTPSSAEVVCSACGEEIRWGLRHGSMNFWHREDVEHHPILGHRVPFTTRAIQQAEAELEGDDDGPIGPLPPVEIYRRPVEPDIFEPRSGIKQVVNLVEKTEGWERYRLTRARGPYVGSKGQCLSISDTIVLGARQVLLDGTVRVAVASWRDGKFDFAYIGIIKDNRLSPHRVDATSMKNWIKGTYDLPEPVQ
jgi:hypothetical protein